ncbi:MAG: hypothetical protein E7316_07885 [Clostridiales bacterium]|nr:hypothetical protein [Clostridiales bacterium]
MKRLEQLPEITEKALGGLTAGQHLKLRIEKAAMKPQPQRRRVSAWVPALSCALVLTIALGIGIPALNAPPPENLITTQAAGQSGVNNEIALLDLNRNNVNIRQRIADAGENSLWASGDSGNFPLIGVNGKYYRMLTVPQSVSGSLLGKSLGSVAEFTTEPALSGTDVILSNAASYGSTVYAINGMGGTLVAAEVNGTTRVFQRVSFNGSAIRGSEDLSDTLQIAGHIVSMELTGTGSVTDSAACEALFATLADCASYESSGSLSGKQTLLITLDNGLAVQLNVKNDKLSACGTWSCPEFFEEFEAAVN